MTKPIITQEFLKSRLRYNKVTGEFTRKTTGKKVGWVDNRGYIKLGLCSTDYLAHRLAWLYVYGEMPTCQIDHLNHARDDNRIENLAASSHRENGRNQKLHITNTSGCCGVRFHSTNQNWVSVIRIDDSDVWLGAHNEWWDAVCARKSANNLYGFHPNHGAT